MTTTTTTGPTPDILYIGPLTPGGTCLQRLNVLRELGCRVETIDSAPREVQDADLALSRRIRRKLFGLKDRAGTNRQILVALRARPFDILWIDKGLTVERQTLERARQLRPDCSLVGFSLDDPMVKSCTSRQFVEHLPLYDIFFTNKSFAVDDLHRLGCRRAEFYDNAYDRNTHRPVPVTPADRERLGGPVGFIGDYEDDRARSMVMLATNGIPVRIWGTNWHKLAPKQDLLRIDGKPVFSRDYAQAICAFDINLGFLRKRSRDLQTTRSVEIPACGGFLLAERTSEHLGLFEEGKEAEFFDSDEELLRKVRYYMEHPDLRSRIALAGHERCLRSGHSAHERLSSMLKRVEQLRSQTR